MNSIIFKTRNELVKVDINNMIYAEADGNYVYIHMRNGMKLMITMSLQTFESVITKTLERENDRTFIRIGRKYIVDKKYITVINVSKQRLVLTDADRISPISINIPKEALKNIKQKLIEEEAWK